MWNRKVFVRIIEVLLCIACVVALRVTDDESRRVSVYLRNRSLEWSQLSNITWGAIGAALATATCGGYIVITAGLLIAAATGELRGRITEVFLLGLGVILFGIIGSLAFASIDSVPSALIDNGAVFGALCLVTCLVFIADMLMKPPFSNKKKKHGVTQTVSSKEQAKQYVTTTTMTINEKEPTKTVTTSWRSPSTPEMTEKRNSMNDSLNGDEDREDRMERSNRQMREYAENIENGRGAPGKVTRVRDEVPSKSNGYYRSDDVYQRPIDEVDDTPPFPTNGDMPVFAKVVNPGIKIMRVERDNERGYDNYRYSDSSQYDNVPTRMRGSSPGILKKQRDVSFADPRHSHVYRPTAETDRRYHHQQQQRRPRDEIERLEECFDALRTSTTTTATQTIGADAEATTKSATPTTPTDPGYVRHTASNWPQGLKSKMPESS